ncbi:MAG: shikimate dehydrogenase [Balneolaceae bacterium]
MIFSFNAYVEAFPESDHLLVVGHPIAHSLSPAMHSAAIAHHGLPLAYHALDLHPAQIASFLPLLNRDGLKGCNITIPHKQTMAEVVDELDDVAAELGVINTIVKDETTGKLVGYNTDVAGFLAPLRDLADELAGERAIVFGTGGAARAVVAGLRQLGAEHIVLVSRQPQTVILHEKSDLHVDIVDYSQWAAYADECALIVNTTPLGMAPNTDQSPVETREAHVLEDKIVYDLVYNPLETSLLRLAREHDAVPISGLEMLIHQGSRSFELWTGHSFPVNKVRSTLLKELS